MSDLLLNVVDKWLVGTTRTILIPTDCHMWALDSKTRARIPKFALFCGEHFRFFSFWPKLHRSGGAPWPAERGIRSFRFLSFSLSLSTFW
jgi:hypothetical protein